MKSFVAERERAIRKLEIAYLTEVTRNPSIKGNVYFQRHEQAPPRSDDYIRWRACFPTETPLREFAAYARPVAAGSYRIRFVTFDPRQV